MPIDFFKGKVDFFQHHQISAKLDFFFVPLGFELDQIAPQLSTALDYLSKYAKQGMESRFESKRAYIKGPWSKVGGPNHKFTIVQLKS